MKNKHFKIKKNLLNTVLRRFTNSNRHYTVRAYHYIPSIGENSNIYRRNFKSRGYYDKVIKYEVCCPDFPCIIEEDNTVWHYYSQYGDQQITGITKPVSIEMPFSADSQSERFIPAYWNRIYRINSIQEIYDQYSPHNDYLRLPKNNHLSLYNTDMDERWNSIQQTEWNTDLYSNIGYVLWVSDESTYQYVFPFNNTNRNDDYDTSVFESSDTLKDGIYIFNYNNRMYAASIGKWDNLVPVYNEPIIVSLDSPDYRVVPLWELLNIAEPSSEVGYNNATDDLFHRAQGFLYYPVKLPSPMLSFLLPVVLSSKGRDYNYEFIDYSDPTYYGSDSFFGRMLFPVAIWWAGQKLKLGNDGYVYYSLKTPPMHLLQQVLELYFDNPNEPDLSLKNYQPYNNINLSTVSYEDTHTGYVSWKEVRSRANHSSFATSEKVLFCLQEGLVTFNSSFPKESRVTDYVRVMYVTCSALGGGNYVKFKIIRAYPDGGFVLDYSHQPYVDECDVIYNGSANSELDINFPYAHVLAFNSVFLGKQFIG